MGKIEKCDRGLKASSRGVATFRGKQLAGAGDLLNCPYGKNGGRKVSLGLCGKDIVLGPFSYKG
jgi:hypothetical protein